MHSILFILVFELFKISGVSNFFFINEPMHRNVLLVSLTA